MQVTTDDLFVLLLFVWLVSLLYYLLHAYIIQQFSYEYYFFSSSFFFNFCSLFSIMSLLWVISHMLEQHGCEIKEFQ